MGIFDGCLLACDVDGTLIKGDYFPPENIKALDFFRSEGGTVCLSTGRTAAALAPIVEQYKGFGPSVVANGSMIYDVQNDEVVFDACLSDEAKQTALHILELWPDIGCELHHRNTVTVISRTKETDDHEEYEKIPTTFSEPSVIFETRIQKALLLLPPGECEAAAKEYVKNISADCTFTYSTCTIKGVVRNYIELLPKGISKAVTLKRLCEHLGVKKGKLFAIGDYYNDVEMINLADVSACPMDSPPEVKACADFTLCYAKDGAVAEFIYKMKEKLQ